MKNPIETRAYRGYNGISRRATSWTANIGPLFADGKTEAEATRNLKAKIPDALTGDWTMRQVQMLGTYAILYRTPAGWFISRTRTDEDAQVIQPYADGPHTSVDKALSQTLGMLAQTVYQQNRMHACWRAGDMAGMDYQTPGDSTYQGQGDNAKFILTQLPEALRPDFARWVGFQRAYQVHRTQFPNSTDMQDHYWACEHDKDYLPELLEYVS